MAVKEFELPEIGKVKLQKRRGTKSLRISISAQNGIKLTMPTWLPYKSGLSFILDRKDWILSNKLKSSEQELLQNARVGKAHVLTFVSSPQATRISTRIVANEARVIHPAHMTHRHKSVQSAGEKVIIKALTAEARALLPGRLAELAKRHGFDYKSVTVKRLSSRWGSCSQQKDITLNCFLMQLPWELIDYVLIHELLHTKIMRHGKDFWTELELYVSNLSEIRKTMRAKQPYFSIAR